MIAAQLVDPECNQFDANVRIRFLEEPSLFFERALKILVVAECNAKRDHRIYARISEGYRPFYLGSRSIPRRRLNA